MPRACLECARTRQGSRPPAASRRSREVANLLFDSPGNNGQCRLDDVRRPSVDRVVKGVSHRRARTGGRWPRAGWAGLERCSVRGGADHANAMPFTLGAPTGRGTGSPGGGAALLRPETDADRPISAHMGLRRAGSNNVGRRAPHLHAMAGRTPNPTSIHCTADSAVSHRPGARTMRAGPCFLSSLNAQRRCATIAS